MKPSLVAGKRRRFVLKIVVVLGVYALGWYSGKRMATGGNLTGANTAKSRPSPAKDHSVPAIIGEAEAKATLAQMIKAAKGKNDNEKIRNYLESLSADTLKALLEDPDAKALVDYVQVANLIGRWAELDPQAALAWTLSHDLKQKDNLIRDIYYKWPADDPAAFASLAQLKGSLHDQMLGYLIDNYASLNPAAAFALLGNIPLGQAYSHYPDVFRRWATNDPTAAAAAALKLPPSEMREQTLESIASSWAISDPNAAITWVNTLPAGAAKDKALVQVLMSMSSQDPSTLAASLANYNITAGDTRDMLLNTLAANFAEQDPVGALAWADKNLTGRDYQTAVVAALQQIRTTDPASAAAYLANITDPGVISQALPNLLSVWGSQDPQAALAWAQALPSDNLALRTSAISNVFSSWIASDPVSAGTYIQQNFVGDPSFKTLTSQVATNWATTDPQGAFNWALSLPVGVNGARINAITTSLSALANVDPQTALQDALRLTGNNQLNAENAVISAWADQAPAQAAAQLQSLPEGTNLDTATANVAKSWLSQDPNAASQWINTLTPGSARDAAVTQLIASASTSDPANAFTWAESIGAEPTRNTQVVNVVTQWAKQNPAAAASAAQNALGNLNGLSADQQTALQKVIAKASSS